MDKAREAIAGIIVPVETTHLVNAGDFVTDKITLMGDDAIEYIRASGWHHEDDVVEGKIIEEDCDGYEGCASDCGLCVVQEREGRPDMKLTCMKPRPATIKDLIGRE